MASDDEDWDSEFGVDVPQIGLSLQRKLTIGNLSKRSKSKYDLASMLQEEVNQNQQQFQQQQQQAQVQQQQQQQNQNQQQPSSQPVTPQRGSLPGTPIRTPLNNNNNNLVSKFTESDDDDWDNMDSPSKSITEKRKEESDDEDWDAEFGGEVKTLAGMLNSTPKSTGSPGIASPQMKILGIKADPNSKMDWDDDFLFNDNSESENKLQQPQVNIISRARSVPVVGNALESSKIPQSITELLSLMQFGNEIDEKLLLPVPETKSNLNSLKVISEVEFKKSVESQNKIIQQREQKSNKLEISKGYYDLGLIYQQNQQQTILVNTQFSTALKIYQEFIDDDDDFDTPSVADYEYETNLYFQLGLSSRLMADVFNAIDYFKKSLEISQRDTKKNLWMFLRVNLELGQCYITSETPVYATRYFDTLVRTVLLSGCPGSPHQHSRDQCLSQQVIGKLTAEQWNLVSVGCFQMAKTLKVLQENDLALGYLKNSLATLRKFKSFKTQSASTQHQSVAPVNENEIINLISELKKAALMVEASDLTTAKDFESEDDEEDWDAELGLNVEEERPILQLTGQSPAVTINSGKDRMPTHYKLLETISNQTFEIVKYPKPSYLYSLTTQEGHLFLHEEALCQWLSNIIVKHLQGQDRALRVVPKASLDEMINEFELSTSQLAISSKRWARTIVEFCFTLHLFGHDETCWDTIYKFFLDIRDYSTHSSQQRLKSNFINSNKNNLRTSNSNNNSNNNNNMNSSINNPPSSPGGSGGLIDEKEAIYHYALQLLYLASKLWTRELDSDYKHMCNGLKGLSNVNSPLVDLIMSECYSHHLYHRSRSQSMDSDETYDSYMDEQQDEGSDEEPELRTRPGEFYQNEEEKVNPIQIFLRVYSQCSTRLQQQTNTTSPNLYRSIPADKEYYEIGTKNAMARALVDIHFYLNGISPLTTKRLDDNVVTQVDASVALELLDANVRMKILTDLYPELPPTYLKAKVAYALGLNAVDIGDLILAEKFLFECLFIIDQVKAPAFGLPLVLSELAANASISYASVLLDNFKYQYAIISFDNALLNLNLRKKPEYAALLRRVAALARENDDINTSIYYYKQILNNYLEDNPQSKTNEIIYICGVISNLYWEKGNYKQSEEYLKVIYFILSRPTTPNIGIDTIPGSSNANKMDTLPKFDNPLFFEHQLNLAKLYLESYHFEKGLELLEYMKKHPLPHGKTNSLIFILAKVYTKKGWFDESAALLAQIDNEDSPHISSSGGISSLISASSGGSGFSTSSIVSNLTQTSSSAGGSKIRTSGIPISLRHGGSGGSKVERNLKYWELQCLNYYHSNKFSEAIICIECAIETCPTSSLSSRGQYFYIRGKIFQKLVSFSSATLITFPTTLRPMSEEWREIVETCTSTSYTCTGDFIQECIASYKRAYHYYKSIGDDVKIQKIVSRIAECYLDRIFGPVALLHYPFDDVARLPHFATSKLIQKDSEQEQQISDLKKRKLKKDSLRVSSTSESSTTSGSANSSVSSVPPPLKEFYITLELIENPAVLALDINIDTCNILLLQRNYMNMAELKFLQGDRELAISYWNECKQLYYTLFFEGPHLIMKSAPLHFIKKIFQISKRMLRFLFAFDQELINKNLMLVDSYLSLELDISQATQRSIESNKPFAYESNPQIDKIFVPYAYQSLTIGRAYKKNRMEVSFTVSKNQKLNDFIHSFSNQKPKAPESPSHVSNLTFGEKTKDEEKSAITGDDVGERVWGCFHHIQNEIRKYSIGKVSQEELSTKNKVIIKQILKVMQSYKNHLASQGSGSVPGSPGASNLSSSSSSNGSNSPVSISSVPLTLSSNNLASLFRSQTKSQLISNNSTVGQDGRQRTPSNAGPTTGGSTITKSMAQKYEEISFNSSSSKAINASLQKLVFSLQIDNYFIHYVPSTGRKRFNRIGGNEELVPQAPPTNMLYLEVYLLSNANEKVSFVVSPLISLEKILLFLCNKPYWAQSSDETSGSGSKKKTSFFGSFSRSNQNSFRTAPKFIEKTSNFHNELISFLNNTIGPPSGEEQHHPDSPPQERSHDNKDFKSDHHHPPLIPPSSNVNPSITTTTNNNNNHHQGVHHSHVNTQPHLYLPNKDLLSADSHGRSMSVGSNSGAGRKIYTIDQLSLISLAKRMVRSDDPAYSKAYVSIDQLSYQIAKVFSHREMRECSEQNPLQLYLFVNSHEERRSLSSLDPTNKTNDQAITFTPEILASINPLLSLSSSPKDPTQEDLDRKKVVNELKHNTFSSLFEILPTNQQQIGSTSDQKKMQSSTGSTSSTSSHTSNSSTSSGKDSTKKSQSKFVFFGSSKSETIQPTTNISTTPLLFICSKSLQVFPWELIMMDLFVVRYLSLYDVLRTNYISDSGEGSHHHSLGGDLCPSFVSVCNSQMEKSQNTDYLKKEYSLRSVLYNLFTSIVIPSANRTVNENHPYHSPLIKIGTKPAIMKKKYKYLEFFDMSVKNQRITSFIETHSYPIIVFTYNDLVDLSSIPVTLLKSKPICTVLFIPNSKQKDIMSKLFKIYENQAKISQKSNQPISKKEKYHFLVSTIQILKEEFNCPIVFFNPSFYVNNENN
ncbi:hypothetical protein DLAC_09901 [Tieghemostelium lacteum]|uniref:Uncharacterized protein n=1 Tax=Tieghemostelium lacteum TaxID=361077 RepID=A0A151Z5K7_TIELA|nr:hypothetical protein DLAC_09901 [Tieghemostelium lacteum]|eukprot:KYQ89246.1 hypothetical protein DLAC_09901 [Tieghemostelium lacteum]